MQRGEALTLTTTWTDPENTMLSERSQTQKDPQCDSIDGKRPEQASLQTESGFLVVRGWGRGWGVTAYRAGLVLGGDKNVLELEMLVAQV